MEDTRKKYIKEFKLEAVRMLEAGTKTGREIEKDLEIGSGQVYRWKKLFVEDGERAFPGNGKPRDAELAELRKENKNLREERDNLRKAVAHLLKTPAVNYQFMAKHLGTYGVEKMARVLSVSRSGYYAWMERPKSVRECQKAELTEQIREIQHQMHHRYGAPRVTKELARRGRSVGHNRVARILREMGLGARPKRRFRVTTKSAEGPAVAANELDRRFSAVAVDQKWVSEHHLRSHRGGMAVPVRRSGLVLAARGGLVDGNIRGPFSKARFRKAVQNVRDGGFSKHFELIRSPSHRVPAVFECSGTHPVPRPAARATPRE